MSDVLYRPAAEADIESMAEIRAGDWGSPDYWQDRIRTYMSGRLNSGQAIAAHACFVGLHQEQVIGLVAGHLTRRFGCDGELQWISVRPEYRNRGVATELLRRLAEWFASRDARRICVDVEPDNIAARAFYGRCGAVDLKPSWMEWKDISAVANLPGR